MNLDAHLRFFEWSQSAAATWLFVVSVASKCATLAYAFAVGRQQITRPMWWLNKMASLAVCVAAFWLSTIAGDTSGQLLFGGLFVVACVWVGRLAMRKPNHNDRMRGVHATHHKSIPDTTDVSSNAFVAQKF